MILHPLGEYLIKHLAFFKHMNGKNLLIALVLITVLAAASPKVVYLDIRIKSSDGLLTKMDMRWGREALMEEDLKFKGYVVLVAGINGVMDSNYILNINGSRQILATGNASGKIVLSSGSLGTAVGYVFDTFSALVINDQYALLITPSPEGEALKALYQTVQAQGLGKFKVGSVWLWGPSPLDRLEEVHEALGEFLVQVNMKFVEDPTIEAPKPPEVSASISHPRIFRP